MPGPQSSTPGVPGYSPFPMARQTVPQLGTPGPQGLTEGAAGGQGVSLTPSQQFYGGGGQPVAPPSSLPAQGAPWSAFGGSGEAPSSFAGGGAARLGAPTMLPPAEQALARQAMAPTPNATPWPGAGSLSAGGPAPMQAQPGPASPLTPAMGQPTGAAMFSGLPGMMGGMPGMGGGAMSVPNVIAALGGGGQGASLGG